MAHKKIIDSVKKQGQVAIKDLDEFLRFIINESDMRTFDANYISILIPMQFDIDKVFGLNVCKRSDDDYVILYSCWYPNKDVFGRQFEMRLYHYDNSNDDDDLGLDIVMTQSQYDAVLQTFSSCCFHDITYDKDIVDKYLARPDFYRLNISLENDCNGTSSDAYLQLTFYIGFSGGYNFASLFSAEYRKDTGWFVVSGEGEVLMGAKK